MNVFTFVISLIAIGCLYEIIKKGMERRDSEYPTEDAELMQQFNRSVTRMERRIEALETILMDRVERQEHTHHEHESAPHARTTE